ncbi:calcium/calmodulin-dependent protein kinase type II subunit beta-like [Lampris incognitus]|uniref:calcium/calmodulin-dependent protein kinase type II subunit beta-like n=1 Tax=Lampris incognitus TaxID=2546036 RepID=UPI0024B5629D|nr:calcium/calmodulin-dependent protein kinase type II subunit beta-like [Lampris incognitus]
MGGEELGLCGAPEVVARHRYGRPVDCWAVGVIMYILLSGNPPFYDETEEENTDLHNRIIFCRIVAGEFEFDSPYWDDISPAAKELVCRLMEVDQMLRITAQDALWHEWIAGNGASEKNLKDGVCAQFEKNFAKAKWRELKKAIRVTTFMQRLRNSEALMDSSAEARGEEQGREGEGECEAQETGGETQGEKGESEEGTTLSDVSLEVTFENRQAGADQEKGRKAAGKEEEVKVSVAPSVCASPTDAKEPICEPSQLNSTPKSTGADPDKVSIKRTAADGARKMAANLGQTKSAQESAPNPTATPKPSKISSPSPASNVEKKHTSTSPENSGRRKMAATLHAPPPAASPASPTAAAALPETRPATQGNKKEDGDGSWCQTQLPEAVAERPVGVAAVPGVGAGVGVDIGPGVRMRSDASPMVRRDRDTRRTDRYSAELNIARGGPATGQGCYTIGSSASLGRHATPYNPEVSATGLGMAGGYGSPYSSLYASGGGMGMYGTGLEHHGGMGMGGGGNSSTTSDWQMDSVIEQIEKQMAAVLEKIEGDMPSLLEQISDCPPEPPRARSAHTSPATSQRARSSHQPSTAALSATPPPLPTSPRPLLPSLPHLNVPPPSYPPPSPPTQPSAQSLREQEDRDGHRGTSRTGQSPRAGMSRGV